MKIKELTVWCLALFLAAACTNTSKTGNNEGNRDSSTADNTPEMVMGGGDTTAKRTAHADISATKADTAGSGKAEFVQKDDGTVEMTLTVDFPKKANSSVAAHFHEHGDCGNAGAEAHGHWNPTNEPHGKWGEGQYHSGDIGNIKLDGQGKGEIKLSSNRWSIGGDEKTNILNRSIIIHSGVDDYKSQPSGNSGSRIGCGIIMAK